MARESLRVKQQRKKNIQHVNTTDAESVAGRVLI